MSLLHLIRIKRIQLEKSIYLMIILSIHMQNYKKFKYNQVGDKDR